MRYQILKSVIDGLHSVMSLKKLFIMYVLPCQVLDEMISVVLVLCIKYRVRARWGLEQLSIKTGGRRNSL